MTKPLNAAPLATLVVAATLGATAGLARAQQAGSVQEGLKLASEVCSECHLVVKSPGRSTDPDAPPFATIANTKGVSSRPEEFHLWALPEPCMTLSSHTAPDVRPLP